jgi:hypothetical protein
MPPSPIYLTTGQIAKHFGVPVWAVRAVLDALGVPMRAGLYRLYPADRLAEVEGELRRRRYLRGEATSA